MCGVSTVLVVYLGGANVVPREHVLAREFVGRARVLLRVGDVSAGRWGVRPVQCWEVQGVVFGPRFAVFGVSVPDDFDREPLDV